MSNERMCGQIFNVGGHLLQYKYKDLYKKIDSSWWNCCLYFYERTMDQYTNEPLHSLKFWHQNNPRRVYFWEPFKWRFLVLRSKNHLWMSCRLFKITFQLLPCHTHYTRIASITSPWPKALHLPQSFWRITRGWEMSEQFNSSTPLQGGVTHIRNAVEQKAL